jgi:hypothetical protein
MFSPSSGVVGPPPQAVLDKKVWWDLLVVLLTVTAILRFLTFDLVGAVLTGLLLSMASSMLSDGMEEMSRYAMIFGGLCAFVCFFDSLLLLTSLSGRSEISIVPESVQDNNDVTQLTYTTTVKTTPFFDRTQGFLYNATSVTMILSPVTMLLGAVLGFHAHTELQRVEALTEEDNRPAWDVASVPPWLRAQPGAALTISDQTTAAAARLLPAPQSQEASSSAGSTQRRQDRAAKPFQGTPHYLEK